MTHFRHWSGPSRQMLTRLLSTVSKNHTSRYLEESKALGIAHAKNEGYDLQSMAEIHVHWGEQDIFRHINNAHYLRYIETGRLEFMRSFGTAHHLPRKLSEDLMKGTGLGFILAEITLKYRSPVTYPDTLLCFHKPHQLQKDRFRLAAILWSLQQRKIVNWSDCIIVGYDYINLKKADFGPEIAEILKKMEGGSEA